MKYQGRYQIFDAKKIKTYPVCGRTNKVKLANLIRPEDVGQLEISLPDATLGYIQELAGHIVRLGREGKPVILFTGAHLIKNGLGPLLIDLVERGVFTLIAGNGATTIHDFELALIGETSEYVPNALETGGFGMAYEFALINTALALGNGAELGYGETLGRTICDEVWRELVFGEASRSDAPRDLSHPEVSLLAVCYRKEVPFTVHVGIGTDVIDQHASFDGCAKGGCSGRDFLIYADQVSQCSEGGVAINIGSAVTGPEVLLKAVSMSANVGKAPRGIITADFDLRRHDPQQMTNESAQGYYFRDQKSVLTRIPEAFGGRGYYIEGNQKQTVPAFYRAIIELL
ncbi:MAG: hypothetical protein JW936_01395 [Sedimentisphaerales bacterium]|nr:hypothetical protein [Sedimentisphaerales bacterium]